MLRSLRFELRSRTPGLDRGDGKKLDSLTLVPFREVRYVGTPDVFQYTRQDNPRVFNDVINSAIEPGSAVAAVKKQTYQSLARYSGALYFYYSRLRGLGLGA